MVKFDIGNWQLLQLYLEVKRSKQTICKDSETKICLLVEEEGIKNRKFLT